MASGLAEAAGRQLSQLVTMVLIPLLGALAERLSAFNTASVRQSVGLGLRYLVGGVVPIRLDYGFILDRRCRDVDRQTGACVRQEEVGNVHFGILYTF